MVYRSTLLAFVVALVIGCGDSSQDNFLISNLNQALYTGPTLKMPLPPGYNWKVNTEAKTGNCGGGCVDDAHTSKMAIDFGRYVNVVNNKVESLDDGVVDVLAAASGTVKEVLSMGCVPVDPSQKSCSGSYAVNCRVLIDHGGGYVTRYLHFANEKVYVNVGDFVTQGQVLGKMGTTGCSTGTHLHFEVFYNNSSATSTSGLTGLKLNGKDLLNDYKYGTYPSSTNGFTFDYASGANLHTCTNEPNGGNAANGWTYTCNRSTNFTSGQTVWTNLCLTNLQKDFCVKMEYDFGSSKIFETGEWCSSTIEADGGWDKSCFWSSFVPTQPGNTWKTLYYVRLKNGNYLPKPMAVTPAYTVASAPTPTIPPAPIPLSPVSNPPYPATTQVSTSLRPVTLSWTSVPTATKYQVYFFIYRGGVWVQYGPWDSTGTTFNVSVVPTATCAWRVAACNTVGCSTYSYAGNFIAVP
jgi:hypothetical protein